LATLDQIQSHYRSRQFDRAAQACETFLKTNASNASVWLTLAECRYQMRVAAPALEAAKRAAAISPSTKSVVTLAKCHAAAGELSEAVAIIGPLTNNQNAESGLTSNEEAIIAATLSQAGCHEAALEHSRAAAEAEPRNSAHAYNYAMCLRAVGDMEGAANVLDRLLKAFPDHWDAYRNRSDLKRWSSTDNHISELRALLERSLPKQAEVQVASALGKELNDCGHWRDAFDAFALSAKALTELQTYDVAADLRRLKHLQTAFSSVPIIDESDSVAPQPIFILGLPRSGTTLLERILSAHSHVTACGELPDFTACFTRQVRLAGHVVRSYEDLISSAIELDGVSVGTAYLKSVSGRFHADRYFTDKMPANSLNVGLILKSLPRARILIMDRGDLDQGYALFRAHFGRHYPYANDLADIGAYLPAHRALMTHWQNIGGAERVKIVKYERLVQRPAETLSDILRFLELSADNSLLDIAGNTLPETSASAAQVREGIHQRSIGSAAEVKSKLGPLIDALDASIASSL